LFEAFDGYSISVLLRIDSSCGKDASKTKDWEMLGWQKRYITAVS